MKKKLFLLPLFAALISTGCSNDEDLAQGGGNNGGTSVGYVAVNIVQPKSMENRAASEGFEYGSTAENEAKEGLFFIFNQDGSQMYGNAQRLAIGGTGEGNNPEVERKYQAVLVVDGVKPKPTTAQQIVCVLNAPEGLETGVTSVTDLKKKIADYSTSASGTFIMSNSVYTTDGKIGETINASQIYKSANQALNSPVEIYVERVVAKVRAKSSEFTNNGARPTIDGVETELDIKVTGIEVANIAKTSYLFKNVSSFNNNSSYNWAWDDTNMRSYWETMPTKLEYSNKSYNDIVTASKPETGDFNIKNVSHEEYVQPNTSDQKTCILVTAQLMKKGTTDVMDDLAYIRGSYTTINGALNVVAAYLATQDYWKKTDVNTTTGEVTYTQLSADDLEWKNNIDFGEGNTISDLKDYEVVAQVKESVGTLYKRDGTAYEDGRTAVNNLMKSDAAKAYRARVFTDGKCYYFVNIDHSPVAGTGTKAGTYEGVVRNHIYDLTLTTIGGIGTPIFDPSDVIIPQKTQTDEVFFLGARVNVLAWRLVTQNVDFTF